MKKRFDSRQSLAMVAESWGLEFEIHEGERPAFVEMGPAAVVDIEGPLFSKPACFFDDYASIRERVSLALASSRQVVVLRIDSPGGEVFGCFDLARSIRDMATAAQKRVVAYVDGQACSAAYALACGASEIYGPRDCTVGSIGTIKPMVDATAQDRALGLDIVMITSGARKADGNPHVRITDGAIAAAQAEIDRFAGMFFELVAEARGLTPEGVAALEAAQFQGDTAIVERLLDGVMTIDGVLTMLASPSIPSARAAGAEDPMDEEKEKMIKALKKAAAGSDEKMAKAALDMLKAIGAYDGGEEEKAESDEGNAKAEEDAPEPKKDEEKKEEAKAESEPDGDEKKASAIAAQVAELAAWKSREEDARARAAVFAERTDLTAEQVKALASVPTSALRAALKAIPVVAKAASNAKAAIAGATAPVSATRGESQGEQSKTEQQRELDIAMGLARPANAVRLDGNKLILGVLTPAEARAQLAKKGAA